MNIGIDIDDTLINTKENQIKCWKEYVLDNPKDGYDENLPEHINRFGDPYINDFWDKYRAVLFDSPFKENVSESIKELKNNGYNIYIITARRKEKYPNLEDKIISTLIEADVPYDGIITNASDKGISMIEHGIDILIDDDILNIESAISAGKKAILFNDLKDYKGPQTNNWNNINKIVS